MALTKASKVSPSVDAVESSDVEAVGEGFGREAALRMRRESAAVGEGMDGAGSSTIDGWRAAGAAAADEESDEAVDASLEGSLSGEA